MEIRSTCGGLYAAKGWMKLVAVMLIIYGALTALTIVGIIVAWLPIWMGVVLYQSAGAAERAYNSEDQTALAESLNKLRTYFTIMGVVTLIGIILIIVSFFLGGFAGIMGAASGP